MKNKKRHCLVKPIGCLLMLAMLLCMAACGGSAEQGEASVASETESASFGETLGGTETSETPEKPEKAEVIEASAEPSAEGEALATTPIPVVYAAMELPAEADEGRILVNGLFQSNTPNPDCGNANGENIATLEVVNRSGAYIDSAAFVVTLTDGRVLSFTVEAIPADTTVWAFELGNQTLEAGAQLADLVCVAYYAEDDQLMQETLEIGCNRTIATITNVTDEPVSDLNAEFHCLFNGVYFGGLTIKYHLDEIPAGATSNLDIAEADLGEAVAARMTVGGY